MPAISAACQMDAALNAWGGVWGGRIHSKFDTCFNIITSNGLASVMVRSPDLPPYAIAVDRLSFKEFEPRAKIGQAISRERQALILDGCRLTFSDIDIYDSKGPRHSFATSAQVAAGAQALRRLIDGCESKSASPHPFYLKQRCNFLKSWKENTPEAGTLIGLGNGLTPSGDDFLAGFYLTRMLLHPADNRLKKLADDFIGIGAANTTDVSAAMLKAAVEYRARSSVWSLLKALITDDTDEASCFFATLSAVGASSGFDWCDGILSALVVHRY